jgi:hypothetical protein
MVYIFLITDNETDGGAEMTKTETNLLNELQTKGKVVISAASGRGAKDGKVSAGSRAYASAVALIDAGLAKGIFTKDTESRHGRTIVYRQIILTAI